MFSVTKYVVNETVLFKEHSIIDFLFSPDTHHILKCTLFDRFSTKKHVIPINIAVYTSNLDHLRANILDPGLSTNINGVPP